MSLIAASTLAFLASFVTLAMSAPPTGVLACLCFIVAAALAVLPGVPEKWYRALLAIGLAVAFWPWG